MFKKREKKIKKKELVSESESEEQAKESLDVELVVNNSVVKRQKITTMTTKEQSEIVKKYVQAEVTDITGNHEAPNYKLEQLPA